MTKMKDNKIINFFSYTCSTLVGRWIYFLNNKISDTGRKPKHIAQFLDNAQMNMHCAVQSHLAAAASMAVGKTKQKILISCS